MRGQGVVKRPGYGAVSTKWTAIKPGSGREKYLRQQALGYEDYVREGDTPLRWLGAGAAAHGLEGEASLGTLEAMLMGVHPAVISGKQEPEPADPSDLDSVQRLAPDAWSDDDLTAPGRRRLSAMAKRATMKPRGAPEAGTERRPGDDVRTAEVGERHVGPGQREAGRADRGDPRRRGGRGVPRLGAALRLEPQGQTPRSRLDPHPRAHRPGRPAHHQPGERDAPAHPRRGREHGRMRRRSVADAGQRVPVPVAAGGDVRLRPSPLRRPR